MPPFRKHIPFVGIDQGVLRDVVALAELSRAIGGSLDSNGKDMTEDACTVRCGGGSVRVLRVKALCELLVISPLYVRIAAVFVGRVEKRGVARARCSFG